MNKQKWQSLLAVLLFLFVLVGLPVLSHNILSKKRNDSIPRIRLFLANTTLEAIHGGDKKQVYDGNNAIIIDDNGFTTLSDVGIRGHGNSTLTLDKRSYQLKLKRRTALLGMEASRKWVLLADSFDTTLLRNDLAFYIERMIGEKWALDGRFTNLSIDNQDLGLYYMTPKVEVSKSSVNLVDDYGVLVEMENLHAANETCYFSKDGNCLVIRDSVNNDKSDEAMKNFVADFDKLLVAAEKKEFDKVEELIDVNSFAQYFLISEFTVNPDAYTTSAFFYKDGLEDRLHAGPGWDFDFAFGNRRWYWDVNLDFHSPNYDMRRRVDVFGGAYHDEKTGVVVEVPGDKNTSKLFYYLIDIPEFKQAVDQLFQKTMSGKCDEIIEYINRQRSYIHDAAVYDSKLWGVTDLDEETDYLVDWIRKRYEHFELKYGEWHLQPWDKAFVL